MIDNKFESTGYSGIYVPYHLVDEGVAYAKENNINCITIYTEKNGKKITMYVVDTPSKTSNSVYKKEVDISPAYFKEGLEHAKKYNILSVYVSDKFLHDTTPQAIDINMDTFEKYDFIEKLHLICSLSQHSEIKGLKALKNLKEFRFSHAFNFDVDFSWFDNLERLNITYSDKLKGIGELKHLNYLQVTSKKIENLNFIKNLPSLKYIRIIDTKITSLNGLENCPNLEWALIQNCRQLVDINETLKKLPYLKTLIIDGSRKIDIEKETKGIDLKNIHLFINDRVIST